MTLTRTEQQADVIVVGGGLAGLTAATYLARQGLDVQLLEKSRSLGGRATTKRQDGFHFNVGPHALYLGGAGLKVLRDLGIEPPGQKVNTAETYALDNDLISILPMGPGSMVASKLLSFTDKLKLMRLIKRIVTTDPETVAHQTVKQWLETHVEEPAVRQLAYMLFRLSTYANHPQTFSAGTAIGQVQLAMKGVRYVDYGWQTLVDSLYEAAQEVGVIAHTGLRVKQVLIDDDHVSGVELADGTVWYADGVVLATSAQIAHRLVPGADEMAWGRYAQQAIPVQAANLNLGLRRLPVPDHRIVIGVDQPLYFSTHSAWAKLAPDDQVVVHVTKYLPEGSQDAEADRAELEAFMDTIQPGWRDEVVRQQFLPHMTVISALPTAASGGLRGRPAPLVDEVRGLVLAGDWIGAEGILADSALASAQLAAHLLAEALPSREPVR